MTNFTIFELEDVICALSENATADSRATVRSYLKSMLATKKVNAKRCSVCGHSTDHYSTNH